MFLNANIENTQAQGKCFPNNKTIKCFLKRRTFGVLRPLNEQKLKRTKVETQNKYKKEETTPRNERLVFTPASNFQHVKELLLQYNVPDIEPYREIMPEIFDCRLYSQDMWNALKQSEILWNWPKPNFIKKQPHINMSMRRVLIDWLVQVQEEYKMHSQCIHLAVSYIDRFLSKMSVVKGKFQLLGVASMFIAGKLEEIYPPFAEEWSVLTAKTFTREQIRRMEKILLNAIDFDVQPPTVLTFIEQLCNELNMDRKILYLAMYFSELMLIESTDYLKHFPSKIASSAVALARLTLTKGEVWPKQLKNFSSYSMKQLSPVIKKQQKIFVESPTKPQQAIQEKYKSPRYRCVSFLKPVALNLDDLSDESSE